MADLHVNSQTPKKESKLHPLTPEQKAANRELAWQRTFVECVIRKVKIFRILSERYHNRREMELSLDYRIWAFKQRLKPGS